MNHLDDTNRIDVGATDTDQIQKALEKMVEHEASAIPHPEQLTGPFPVQPAESGEPAAMDSQKKPAEDSPVHEWFFTFMCMNIPLVGWIYLMYLAFSKKRTERRSFARAYLFYKLLFLVISVVLLGIVIYIGLDMMDQLLAYMEML